jgi:hypothetical protein
MTTIGKGLGFTSSIQPEHVIGGLQNGDKDNQGSNFACLPSRILKEICGRIENLNKQEE